MIMCPWSPLIKLLKNGIKGDKSSIKLVDLAASVIGAIKMIRESDDKAVRLKVVPTGNTENSDYFRVHSGEEKSYEVRDAITGITCTCMFGTVNVGKNMLCSHMKAVIFNKLKKSEKRYMKRKKK